MGKSEKIIPILILVIILVAVFGRRSEGFKSLPEIAGVYSRQIPNKVPPPDVGMTDKVRYSSADLQSNIEQVKEQLKNLKTDRPDEVLKDVGTQLGPIVQGIVKQSTYPMGSVYAYKAM